MKKKRNSPTPQEKVAEYMYGEFVRKGELHQDEIVYEIENRFGQEFIYTNANGNLAIDPQVLKAFRELTPDAVWERGSRLWRRRENFDEAGSRAQE